MGIYQRDSKGRIKKGNNFKHGLSNDPVYDCWIAMKARCLNMNNPQYFNYGGRGIEVCDRWLNSFDNFISDLGNKPNKLSTIDRIDNNGNYEPSNCRWISIQEQQMNRRDNNIVPGVSFEKSRNKWHSSITRNGDKRFLGRYTKFSDAVKARKKAEKEYVY